MILKKCCVVVLAGFLAACASPNDLPIEPIPEITFQHIKPMSLNVADVEVLDRTERVPGVVYVGQRFPTSPQKALQNWVRDRMSADGTSGVARVIVFEASAVEEKLETSGGVKGFVTDEQAEKYTVTMNVRVEFDAQNGRGVQFVNTSVQRHTTIVESATLQERELIWFELVEQLMSDFDNRMGENINSRILSR